MITSLMIRLLAAIIAILAITASPASAKVTGDWGRYADIASRFNVPLPDAYVHRGGCPAEYFDGTAPACASQTGEIWLPDSESSRFALAHELGHVFDAQYLTVSDREWLRRVMRAPSGPWWDARYGAAEWFADYYADCAVGNQGESLEGYADRPTPRQLRRVCMAIRVWGILRSAEPPRP